MRGDDQKVEYDRQELPNLSEVKAVTWGNELEIDSKNDYEYLVFEDMKAAGFEPVEVRSGYNGNDMGAYVEFRDNRVVFFARRWPGASTAYRIGCVRRRPAFVPCPRGPRRCTLRN